MGRCVFQRAAKSCRKLFPEQKADNSLVAMKVMGKRRRGFSLKSWLYWLFFFFPLLFLFYFIENVFYGAALSAGLL